MDHIDAGSLMMVRWVSRRWAVFALLCAGGEALGCSRGDPVGPGVGDALAGTICQDMPVRCGDACWYEIERMPRPLCGYVLEVPPEHALEDIPLCWGPFLAPGVVRVVGGVGGADVPDPPGYRARRDGSEAVVVALWYDDFARVGAVNHCHATGTFLYVIDFVRGEIVHAVRLGGEYARWPAAWDCPAATYCFDQTLCEMPWGDEGPCRAARSEERGVVMYVEWANPVEPSWRFEGDVLGDSVHRYVLSTGEYLESVDLPVL